MEKLFIEIRNSVTLMLDPKLDHEEKLDVNCENNLVEIIIPCSRWVRLGPFNREFQEVNEIKYILIYSNPNKIMLEGLTNKNSVYVESVKEEIYNKYVKINKIFKSLMRNIAGIYNLNIKEASIFELLKEERVNFWINEEEKRKFKPKNKNPTRKNYAFKDRLLTIKKLKNIQQAAIIKQPLSETLDELIRVKHELMEDKRLACLLSIIIVEWRLKQYLNTPAIKMKIASRGLQYRRKGKPGLNYMLETQLSGILGKTELKRLSKCFENVLYLNTIRNNIMHKYVLNDEIKRKDVLRGITAAIRLVSYLDKQEKK